MAFGFLLERLYLFLQMAALTLHTKPPPVGTGLGESAGLGLLLAAVIIIIAATIRFVRTNRDIARAEFKPIEEARSDIGLAILLVLLGLAIALYLSHAIVSAPHQSP
jgi:uncharacterized membrane protein YidH (DUF202 family)